MIEKKCSTCLHFGAITDESFCNKWECDTEEYFGDKLSCWDAEPWIAKEEYETLEAALQEARMGLEFYTNKHSWVGVSHAQVKNSVVPSDMYYSSDLEAKFGGKTARAALKKIDEILKAEKE